MWAFATQAAAVVLLAAHTVFQLRRLARLRADLRHAEVMMCYSRLREHRGGRHCAACSAGLCLHYSSLFFETHRKRLSLHQMRGVLNGQAG
jgi:hypothetical protein